MKQSLSRRRWWIILCAGLTLVAVWRTVPSEHRVILSLGSDRAHLRFLQLACSDEQQHRTGGQWWFTAADPAPPQLTLDVHAVGQRTRCSIELRSRSGAVATEQRVLPLDADRLTLRLETSVQRLRTRQVLGPASER